MPEIIHSIQEALDEGYVVVAAQFGNIMFITKIEVVADACLACEWSSGISKLLICYMPYLLYKISKEQYNKLIN